MSFGEAIVQILDRILELQNTMQQKKIQNHAQCYELYQTRRDVYMLIDSVFVSVERDAKVKSQDIVDFKTGVEEAKFLFDNDFLKICKKVLETLVELYGIGSKIEFNAALPCNQTKYEKWCEREEELLKKLCKDRERLSRCALKYISLAKCKMKK